jgi:hypothetical protein
LDALAVATKRDLDAFSVAWTRDLDAFSVAWTRDLDAFAGAWKRDLDACKSDVTATMDRRFDAFEIKLERAMRAQTWRMVAVLVPTLLACVGLAAGVGN